VHFLIVQVGISQEILPLKYIGSDRYTLAHTSLAELFLAEVQHSNGKPLAHI
jgi:hypothetical protein